MNKQREDLNNLFLHIDKPYRVLALHAIHTEVEASNFWHLFHYWWNSVENPSDHLDKVLEMLDHTSGLQQDLHFDPSRLNEMDDEDLDAYNDLPYMFTVYRGCHGFNEDGVSWTTDEEVAKKFALRMAIDGKCVLIEGTVHKNDIIAYYLGRGEKEIVVHPRHVIHTGRSRAEHPEFESLVKEQETNAYIAVQTGRFREHIGEEANLNIAMHHWAWSVEQKGYEVLDDYIVWFSNMSGIADKYNITFNNEWFTGIYDKYKVAKLIQSKDKDACEEMERLVNDLTKVRKAQEKMREEDNVVSIEEGIKNAEKK